MTPFPYNSTLLASILDAELLEHIRKRDRLAEEALEELHRRYWRMVQRRFGLLVGDWDAADDLAQELFIALWYKAPGIVLKGSFRGYLFGWVYKRAIDYSRSPKNKRTYPLFLENEDGDVYEAEYLPHIEGIEDEAIVPGLLTEALTKLSDLERQCYLLYSFREYSQASISKMLGISEKQISKYVCHARDYIRTYLRLGGDTEMRKTHTKKEGGIPSDGS